MASVPLTIEIAPADRFAAWLFGRVEMARAVGCFRQADFEVLPYPVDYRTPGGAEVWRPSSASVRNVEKVHFAIREYLGLLAYWVQGRTDALFPAPEGATVTPAGSSAPASGTAG